MQKGDISVLSEEEVLDLKFMIERGFTRKQVSEVLGKSVPVISTYIKTHNIKSPRSSKEKNGFYFCPRCKTYKTKEEFHKGRNRGIATYCKPCTCELSRESYKEKRFAEIDNFINAQKVKEKTKEEMTGCTEKKCSKCQKTKGIDEFNWLKKNEKVRPECRECQTKHRTEWRLKKLEERGY